MFYDCTCQQTEECLKMLVLSKQLGWDDIKRLEDIKYEERAPADDEHKNNYKEHGDNLIFRKKYNQWKKIHQLLLVNEPCSSLIL